jgi:hypothetical protein
MLRPRQCWPAAGAVTFGTELARSDGSLPALSPFSGSEALRRSLHCI